MRLTFLGTGTSTGVPLLTCKCAVCKSADTRDQRTRPSLLIEFGDRVVVVDTTPDFRQQALREGIQRLDAVLFTHTHADHIMGLDDVRAFYFRQQIPIPIYASARSMDDLRRVFDYIFDQSYPYGGLAKLDPHVINGPFELWGETFVPVPVMHGDLPILGFRFGKVVYIADFSTIPDDTLPLLQDLDVLVLESLRHTPHPAHSTVEQSVAWVERLKPRRAFFTHITHELGHESTNASLPPRIRLAYDGLTVEV